MQYLVNVTPIYCVDGNVISTEFKKFIVDSDLEGAVIKSLLNRISETKWVQVSQPGKKHKKLAVFTLGEAVDFIADLKLKVVYARTEIVPCRIRQINCKNVQAWSSFDQDKFDNYSFIKPVDISDTLSKLKYEKSMANLALHLYDSYSLELCKGKNHCRYIESDKYFFEGTETGFNLCEKKTKLVHDVNYC